MEAFDLVVAASTHPPLRRAAPAHAIIDGFPAGAPLLKRALQAICDWGRIHMELTNAVEKAPQVLLKGRTKKKSGAEKGSAIPS